jgi:flagellar biosynthesis protein FlhF
MKIENENLPVTVEEIQALRKEILQLHESLAKDMIGHSHLVQKVVNIFVNKGLEQRWVEKLLAPLVGSTFEEDEVILVAYLLEELDSLLKVKEESTNLEKRVHILIGGTGIGKTSLVGKLGARYTYLLKEHYKVAFFNFDYQKVGAIEQLEHYADAMDIPIISLEDFSDNEYDIILVDTAGNMGENSSELKELIEIIEQNSLYRVEVSLVLSATSKRKDLKQIIERFDGLTIESYIFTKLDETSDLSDMINFLMKEERPLSYLSIGQAIPEDLIVATKEYLLNQFMNEEKSE